MQENLRLAEQMRAIATVACTQLFEAYDVSLVPAEADPVVHTRRLLCGIVGFVGSGIRGTCLLSGTERPIADSCPEGGLLRDWVGELANQLTGRLKSRLLACNVEVALTTPVVLSGVQLKLLPRNGRMPTVLRVVGVNSDPSEEVMVWVEMDSEPGFELNEVEDCHAQVEGKVLLF